MKKIFYGTKKEKKEVFCHHCNSKNVVDTMDNLITKATNVSVMVIESIFCCRDCNKLLYFDDQSLSKSKK